jgi:serine/threonine protein kinase
VFSLFRGFTIVSILFLKEIVAMSEVRHCPECKVELPPGAPDGPCAKCLALHGQPTAAPTPPTTEFKIPSGQAGYFTAPAPADLAAHFPQLEILELIGQGGMGAVYKARQSKLDRLVALKVLPPESAKDPTFAERFTREARALAKLNHPNIVTVYDFGQAGDLWFFVMEYVDGANLRRVLQGSRVAPPDAMRIVPQICDALQFAHDEGIVHRDVKPENILVDKRGRVKIADFGIAKIVGRNTGAGYTLTGPWQVVGTLHYMAPEQIDNPLKVDHRADIYSLGVVFYEMLTGQLPLGRFPPPSQKVKVDTRLDQVVLRALENEPDRRYQHASEVRTDVEAITLGGPQPATATHAIPPASQSAGTGVVASTGRFAAGGPVWKPAIRVIVEHSVSLVRQLSTLVFQRDAAPTTSYPLPPTPSGPAARTSTPSVLPAVPVTPQSTPPVSSQIPVAGAAPRTPRPARLPSVLPAPEGPPRLTPPMGRWEEGILVSARRRLRIPAALLFVAGLINTLTLVGVTGIPLSFQYREAEEVSADDEIPLPHPNAVRWVALTGIAGPFIILGAWKMRRLSSYRMALVASVLAIISPPAALIGAPAAVWSFLVLSRRSVREAFCIQRSRRLALVWKPYN